MPHFFISYAKKDTRELALQLNEALNRLPNVTAWVDKSLKAGKSWELQIQTEIDRCDYMIVLYSPDINRHKRGAEESYMLSEIHYAKRIARKQIIPVMAQITEPPMILTMEQYIDFTLSGLGLDDLIAAICDGVGIAVETVKTTSAEPPVTTQNAIWVGDRLEVTGTVRDSSLSLMPQPFAWIDIPGKGYRIAKYPITNAQFAKFIEADGYENRQWWTDAGWKLREKGLHYDEGWKPSGKAWTQPRYWTEGKWNGVEQPVVGISWYEAVAFCWWLSERTGEKIMLPTEDQWHYAAQGDDGRDYPWGNEWDANRCNNNVDDKGSGKTTSVRQFEGKGDNPFGIVDMVGNVWEWCLTDFEDKTNDVNSAANNRVLRGGSWKISYAVYFQCSHRGGGHPDTRDNDWGFRISRS